MTALWLSFKMANECTTQQYVEQARKRWWLIIQRDKRRFGRLISLESLLKSRFLILLMQFKLMMRKATFELKNDFWLFAELLNTRNGHEKKSLYDSFIEICDDINCVGVVIEQVILSSRKKIFFRIRNNKKDFSFSEWISNIKRFQISSTQTAHH